MSAPISAIVLAGGQSRRLGQDKRVLRLGGERTQLELTVQRVAQLSDDVIVVLAHATPVPESLELESVRFAWDRVGDGGPLAGLAAGLAVMRSELAVAVACDLPFLSVGLLRALADWPGDYDALLPRRADGTIETLHAMYRRTCLATIDRCLAERRLKLAALGDDFRQDGLTVRYLDETELSQFNPDLRSFFNVNTPEDLRAARGLLHDSEPRRKVKHNPR